MGIITFIAAQGHHAWPVAMFELPVRTSLAVQHEICARQFGDQLTDFARHGSDVRMRLARILIDQQTLQKSDHRHNQVLGDRLH